MRMKRKMSKKRGHVKFINDFKIKYFPQKTAEEAHREKTPQELGILWARDAFKKIKKKLKNCYLT